MLLLLQLGQGYAGAPTSAPIAPSWLGSVLTAPGSNAVALPHGAVSLSAAGSTVCAVDARGQLRCWGGCATGQCGYSWTRLDALAPTEPCWDAEQRALLCPMASPIDVDGGGRLWDPSSPAAPGVLRGPADTVQGVVVAPSGGYVCADLAASGVKCWGANGCGQLGYGVIAPVLGGASNGYNYPWVLPCAGSSALCTSQDPCKSAAGDLTCPGKAAVIVRGAHRARLDVTSGQYAGGRRVCRLGRCPPVTPSLCAHALTPAP